MYPGACEERGPRGSACGLRPKVMVERSADDQTGLLRLPFHALPRIGRVKSDVVERFH
jgi:hypothetical protein